MRGPGWGCVIARADSVPLTARRLLALDGTPDRWYTLAMSAVLKPMSLEAFLDWEIQQELKYEFDGFKPVGMTGVSAAHSRIQVNLLGLMFNALRGRRCQPHGSDLKVQVAGRIRYPDMLSSSARPFRLRRWWVHDPVVVFAKFPVPAVQSDKDHFRKELWKYRAYAVDRAIRDAGEVLASVQKHSLFPDRRGLGRQRRIDYGDDELALPEVGITLPIAELYEGVTFSLGQGEVQAA